MIADIAGVILAGGKSSRFGTNKALAPLQGKPMISHVMAVVESLFAEHLLVTNTPEEYSFTGWSTTPDIYPDAGPLAGIHAALVRVKSSRIFVAGCDMPFLNPALIQYICSHTDADIVIPETTEGFEPLHALYHKHCLEQIAGNLQSGQHRLHYLFAEMKTKIIAPQDIAAIDPEQISFRNINHQHDLQEFS